jgi:hypothetical protein
MFFSADERALLRGRRSAARTETCRPCVLKLADGREFQGVILNLNAHGMLVRMMEALPAGAVANVQMMRDDSFSKPMSPPRQGKVIRLDSTDGTFYDLAFRFKMKSLPGRKEPVVRAGPSSGAPIRTREPSRMQTLDLTLGEARRGGRRR